MTILFALITQISNFDWPQLGFDFFCKSRVLNQMMPKSFPALKIMHFNVNLLRYNYMPAIEVGKANLKFLFLSSFLS